MAKKVKTEFEPLLSATYERRFPPMYPVLGSIKLDGIRLVIKDGVPYTRSLKKPAPNLMLQRLLNGLPSFDGEIIAGVPWDLPGDPVCGRSQSLVMSEECPEWEKDWTYWIFDYAGPEARGLPFETRLGDAKSLLRDLLTVRGDLRDHLKIVHHEPLRSEEELWAFEDKSIRAGYEGIMVRQPGGEYKWGRATAKERILTKFKRWEDAEGIITEVHAEEENTNEKKTNALGKSERSSHKAGKVPKEVIGGYTVRTKRDKDGFFGLDRDGPWVEFFLGAAANVTAEWRAEQWHNRTNFLQQTVKFEYQYTKGVEKPRFPGYLMIRLPE